jgi:hypothetical protein
MRILFLTGIAACLRSFRTSLFARTTLVLFLTMYGAQWPLWGHEDWSQNCYTIIPICGILLMALRALENAVALVRSRAAYAVAVAGLCASISAVEYDHYFTAGFFYDRHYKQDPYDTKTQLTLALRDAQKVVSAEGAVVFMPVLRGPRQAVSYDARNLEWRNPRILRVMEHVRFFHSPEDLAARVERIQKRTGRKVRVYFGVPSPEALGEIERYRQALPAGTELVQVEPYREVMAPRIRLYLTYVDVPPPSEQGRTMEARSAA